MVKIFLYLLIPNSRKINDCLHLINTHAHSLNHSNNSDHLQSSVKMFELFFKVIIIKHSCPSCNFYQFVFSACRVSNDHKIVSSLICGCQNKPRMEFLDPFLQISKSEFRFR